MSENEKIGEVYRKKMKQNASLIHIFCKTFVFLSKN